MVETIVVFICIAGSLSCGEATSSYYQYNIELQQWANRKQMDIENKIGKDALSTIGGISGAILVKKGIINMQRNLNLIVDERSMQLQAHWEN